MTFQGTATVSRVTNELMDAFKSMGFEFNPLVASASIRSMISESDVIGDRNTEAWVEAAASQPGDLEEYPHLVYCLLDLNNPGAVTAKTYRPVSLW